MPGDLVLYGASNPCTLKVLSAINRVKPTWNLLGFLDDTSAKHGEQFMNVPILGGRERIEELKDQQVTFFNNVFGSTVGRREVAATLADQACRLTSLITPDTDLELVRVGDDVAIEARVAVDVGTEIRDHCCLKRSASVGHENLLEDFVFVGPAATLCGRVTVREGAYLGAGCCILPQLELGRNCVVGAGAVVTCDVPPGVTVVGNPAKPR